MRALTIGALTLLAGVLTAVGAKAACAPQVFEGHEYVACVFDPATDDLRLFLNDEHGAPYGHFERLEDSLTASGETLVFAMNAGMYREDRSPVGHYVERGVEARGINRREGPGNFHLLPNGVFWIVHEQGAARARVAQTPDYPGPAGVAYATQSGPMLVIDGALHSAFDPASISLKRRNGVGVRADGKAVFAITDTPVSFHDFARFFRDGMKTPNALFLDGSISRLHAPGLARRDLGAAMGPIVGVVAPLNPN